MTAYYNEHDPWCCDWLRALIAAGQIAPGDVDSRGIEEVTADDVRGYTQAHFFAGIGGWSLALRLAGWPDDRPIWTGSAPCQPFSTAGKRRGAADERHLWPAFHGLIAECRPATVVGEQVASGDGRAWLTAVRLDLEALGYACGAADLCAAGVGAPHIRQRLYWVADASHSGRKAVVGGTEGHDQRQGPRGAGVWAGLFDGPVRCGAACGVADAERRAAERHGPALGGAAGGVQGYSREQRVRTDPGNGIATGNPWAASRMHPCRDGVCRPVPLEPALFPVADGLSTLVGRDGAAEALAPWRVGMLKGAGNAIVPQVGAAFLRAVMGVVS